MSNKGLILIVNILNHDIEIIVTNADKKEWCANTGNQLLNELLETDYINKVWEAVEIRAKQDLIKQELYYD